MVEKHRLLPDTHLPVDFFSFEDRLDGTECGMSISANLFELRDTGDSKPWNPARKHACNKKNPAMSPMGWPGLGSGSSFGPASIEAFQSKTRTRATRSHLNTLDTCCLKSVGIKT